MQEFCLDLYQPSGVGRKRRDTAIGKGEVYFQRPSSALTTSTHRIFYPVTAKSFENHHHLSDETKDHHPSADIKDNVGLTVVVPEPKNDLFRQTSRIETKLRFANEDEVVKEVEATHPSSRLRSQAVHGNGLKVEDCQTFVIIGGVLGSLLVTASVMMCILSQRLYKLTKRYRREKLDDMVAEHRRKFRPSGSTLFQSRTTPYLHGGSSARS